MNTARFSAVVDRWAWSSVFTCRAQWVRCWGKGTFHTATVSLLVHLDQFSLCHLSFLWEGEFGEVTVVNTSFMTIRKDSPGRLFIHAEFHCDAHFPSRNFIYCSHIQIVACLLIDHSFSLPVVKKKKKSGTKTMLSPSSVNHSLLLNCGTSRLRGSTEYYR